VILLVAAVVTVALLYQGYVGALADNFDGRLIYPDLPGAAALHLPGITALPQTFARVSPTLILATWDVTTAHGNTQVAGVIGNTSNNWPSPEGGEVWLPASLKGQVYQETIGHGLLLTHFGRGAWQQAELKVAGYYEDGGYLSPLLVNQDWVSSWLGNQSARETIYIYPEGDYSRIRDTASRIPNSRWVMLHNSLHGAKYLVGNMYAGGSGAIVLGIAFLAIGIGTFALLVFLDSRSEMAILKAHGLKPGEASRLLLLDFSLSSLLGLLLGAAGTYLLQGYISLPLKLDLTLLRYGLLLVATAFAIALFAPSRFLYVASVNELLFKRPILLFVQVINHVEGNRPALDDLTKQGLTCLKLERDESGFLGSIIPSEGNYVRKGELLAWQQIWFGMAERRYVAPHDGVLQLVDQQRGVLAISGLQVAAYQAADNGGTDNQ
jgi:hypothetical protein